MAAVLCGVAYQLRIERRFGKFPVREIAAVRALLRNDVLEPCPALLANMPSHELQ